MRRLRRWTPRLAGESGNASLEFVTAGLILLVPIVYLVVAMASIQGAQLAAESASRQAARVFVEAENESDARARAAEVVRFALADHSLKPADADVRVSCAPAACLARLSTVRVEIVVHATLPLVPDVLDLRSSATVPVRAVAVQRVSKLRADR